MNLLVMLTRVLQAYNTRQVQHYSGWPNNLLEKACLKSISLFGGKRLRAATQSKMGCLISPCHFPAFIMERGIEWVKANTPSRQNTEIKSNYNYNSFLK